MIVTTEQFNSDAMKAWQEKANESGARVALMICQTRGSDLILLTHEHVTTDAVKAYLKNVLDSIDKSKPLTFINQKP